MVLREVANRLAPHPKKPPPISWRILKNALSGNPFMKILPRVLAGVRGGCLLVFICGIGFAL
jgi:hypothetical protein